MKTSMNSTTPVLAALFSIAIGCQGQPVPGPVGGMPMASAATVPLHLDLSTYLNGSYTEIVYDLDSRFLLTVTKEQLRAARSIHDIVPGHLKQEHVSYSAVSIRILEDDKYTDLVVVGSDHVLSAAQLELLRSLDYSSNFMIRAEYSETNPANGSIGQYDFTPHLTIVPEHEAANSLGKEAMIAHVRNGTSAFAYVVDAKALRSGKVYFTVAKDGAVSGIRLSESSGYPLLDEKVMELVHTLPGSWTPATNAAGEAVEQVFVFSFGAVGC